MFFGVGWWMWIDACVCRPEGARKIKPAHYVPGFIATLALLLMNMVSRARLKSASVYDGQAGRAKLWLFFSYLISVSSLIASIWILAQDYAPTPHVWPGVAGVLQCFFILVGGLMFWGSRGRSSEYNNY